MREVPEDNKSQSKDREKADRIRVNEVSRQSGETQLDNVDNLQTSSQAEKEMETHRWIVR